MLGGRARPPSVPWARPGDEPMGEVAVDAQSLANALALHDHEADTVHEAVVLVMVTRQQSQRVPLLIEAGTMKAPKAAGQQLLTDRDGESMPD